MRFGCLLGRVVIVRGGAIQRYTARIVRGREIRTIEQLKIVLVKILDYLVACAVLVGRAFRPAFDCLTERVVRVARIVAAHSISRTIFCIFLCYNWKLDYVQLLVDRLIKRVVFAEFVSSEKFDGFDGFAIIGDARKVQHWMEHFREEKVKLVYTIILL